MGGEGSAVLTGDGGVVEEVQAVGDDVGDERGLGEVLGEVGD